MKHLPERYARASFLTAALLFAAGAAWQFAAAASSGMRAAKIAAISEKWAPQKDEKKEEKKEEVKSEGANGAATTQPATPDAASPPAAPTPAPDPYAEISQAGFFGPPMPGAPPPTISAIIAGAAILDGQEVQVGATIGAGYKVIEILPNKVVVEKDGNKTDLVLFESNGQSASNYEGGFFSRVPQ